MHYSYLTEEVEKLKNHQQNKNVCQKFLSRLKEKNVLRSENLTDHFCVFFLPVDKKSKSIYLGHHIKANDWIPPGGHIEKNEHPKETIKREMREELTHDLTTESIELFDLTIKNINNPTHPCKRHYDLWYLIYMDKKDFIFDKGEFYNAGWFSKNTLPTIILNDYENIIKKVLTRISPPF